MNRSLMPFSRFWRRSPPAALRYGHVARSWLVLQQGPNPSTDYYVRPRVQSGGLPVVFRDIDADTPQLGDLEPGTQVVIVRYLTRKWADALWAQRSHLAGVVYFMDDDLLDPSSWADLPAPYRRKLKDYCERMRPAIERLASEYWGSTPALCDRYVALDMKHVPPRQLPEDEGLQPVAPQPEEPVTIFYHGTQSHMAEIRWLRPVIAEVLAACPNTCFEIIGNHEVNKLYRDLPRTRVLHPMTWPNYLSHCRSMRGHIGLAPLMQASFNTGRSHTKVFDIARCRARGFVAEGGPYSNSEQMNFMHLLPMQYDCWIRTVQGFCVSQQSLVGNYLIPDPPMD